MVTLNMLVEFLGCRVLMAPANMRKPFAYPELLFNAPDHPDAANPSGRDQELDRAAEPDSDNILYMGTPDAAERFLGSRGCSDAACGSPEAFVLCVTRPGQDVSRLGQYEGSILICECKANAAWLFNKAQGYMMRIADWERRLDTLLLKGGSYQDAIDASEELLGNFMTVSNSEFELMAYTRHHSIDDPIAVNLIETGRHAPETIERFRQLHAMRDWQMQKGVALKEPNELVDYPILDYVYRMQGSYFIHANLYCSETPYSDGLRDLFQIFTDHLRFYVQHEWDAHLNDQQETVKLFDELIEDGTHPSNGARNMARRLGISEDGTFRLFGFLFDGDPSERSFDPYHVRLLQDLFISCHVSTHGEYVLMLDPSDSVLHTRLDELHEFIDEHPCSVGASDAFKGIESFYPAFKQTEYAIEQSDRMTQTASDAPRSRQSRTDRLQLFGDHLLSYLVETALKADPLADFSVSTSTVARIAEFDREHGTSDLKILYHYLANERKASKTCEVLYMHRSSLLYRINRMQERFGFDLEENTTRLRLLTEYLILMTDRRSEVEI